MARKLGPAEYYKTEYRASTPDENGFRYSADGKRLFRAPAKLKEYAIPEGVETICDNAFKGRVTYTKITLPSTLKHVGKCAFMGCKNLTHISPVENLESIGDYAFSDSGIEAIDFPPSCQVSEKAFEKNPVIVNPNEQKREKEYQDRTASYILVPIGFVIVIIPLICFYRSYGLNWLSISSMILDMIWLIYAVRFLTFKETLKEYKFKLTEYRKYNEMSFIDSVPNSKEEKGCNLLISIPFLISFELGLCLIYNIITLWH